MLKMKKKKQNNNMITRLYLKLELNKIYYQFYIIFYLK